MSDMVADELLANHMANFNPEIYLANFDLRKTLDPGSLAFLNNFVNMYHDVFSAHSPGERLLDVGSGPTLWHLMSASAKYKSITLSDPLPQNRDMQQIYMNDVSQDDRWTENFKVIARLEGNEKKWQEVGTRLRSSIRDVIWCNIHEDHPLGEERADDLFDCVMSSLCLEAACKDVASYTKAVKNLVSLAKPGARIVMGGVLNQSFYQIGEGHFKCLPLTPEIIQSALTGAGCTITKFMSSDTLDKLYADNQGTFTVAAHK